VPNQDPGLGEGVLEGVAAAEEKADQIVAPDLAQVASPLGQLAVSIDPISGGRRSGGLRREPKGLGLRVQKEANSAANSAGSRTRLACW